MALRFLPSLGAPSQSRRGEAVSNVRKRKSARSLYGFEISRGEGMNICGRNHNEIVFDGKRCPLCEALERIEQLEQDLAKAEEGA